MTLRIQRVTCKVTVRSSSPAAAAYSVDHREPSPRGSVAPSNALQRTLEAGESTPGQGDSAATTTGNSSVGNVDPKKVADQVYRLMRDELRIARERE